MKILVASATKPTPPNTYADLFDLIREEALDFRVLVTKGLFVPGPGCNNYAFELVGKEEDCNRFGKALCLSMMPAKWGGTDNHIPEGFNCEITENTY